MGFSLGGFGAGIARGAEDWRRDDEEKRRKQEFQFLQEQRQRMQREQAEGDQLREGLKGVRTTRTENLNPVQNDDEGYALPAATRETPRSLEEINRERAAVYGKFGRPEQALQYEQAAEAARRGITQDQLVQLQLDQGRLALSQAETASKDQQLVRDLLTARRAVAGGNLTGAYEQLRKMYGQVPDGYDLHMMQTAEGPVIGRRDKEGNWVEPPQKFDANAINGMIGTALEYSSLGQYNTVQGQKLQGRQVSAAERTAAATETRARTDADWYAPGGKLAGYYQSLIDKNKADAARLEKFPANPESFAPAARGPNGEILWSSNRRPGFFGADGKPYAGDPKQVKGLDSATRDTGPRVNPDGTLTMDGTVYERDIKTNKFRPIRIEGRTRTDAAIGQIGPEAFGPTSEPQSPRGINRQPRVERIGTGFIVHAPGTGVDLKTFDSEAAARSALLRATGARANEGRVLER